MTDGPYSIGSTEWPGVSKLVEEAGELLQVLGKLLAIGTVTTEHWDGDLRPRISEEVADLYAALDFFLQANPDVAEGVQARRIVKRQRFHQWHSEGDPAPYMGGRDVQELA